MKVMLLSAIFAHVPTLEELRARMDPDKDKLVQEFEEDVDVSLYMKYTGLRIYTNGKNRYLVECKYTISDGVPELPEYTIPPRHEFILK